MESPLRHLSEYRLVASPQQMTSNRMDLPPHPAHASRKRVKYHTGGGHYIDPQIMQQHYQQQRAHHRHHDSHHQQQHQLHHQHLNLTHHHQPHPHHPAPHHQHSSFQQQPQSRSLLAHHHHHIQQQKREPQTYGVRPETVRSGTHYYNQHLKASRNGSHLQLSLEYHDAQAIQKQIEWYFEDSSLEKDIYLRTQMDARGYVPATILAAFNRLKKFNITAREIVNASRRSKLLKVKNGCVKRRDMWFSWVLPGDKVQDISLSSDEEDFETQWHLEQQQIDEQEDVKMKDGKKMDDSSAVFCCL